MSPLVYLQLSQFADIHIFSGGHIQTNSMLVLLELFSMQSDLRHLLIQLFFARLADN
jgi:hypothetical protein